MATTHMPAFKRRIAPILAMGLLVSIAPAPGRTDNFQGAAYDPATDELVVDVIYSGTNPDHEFTLEWGPCETLDNDAREIGGEVLDSQSRDAAQRDFSKTVRFNIADLDCRPATITLRTAPRSIVTLRVPARRTTAP